MSRCSACYGKGYYVLTLLGEDDYQVVVCECQVTKEREGERGSL
jgi:hypothetical protein